MVIAKQYTFNDSTLHTFDLFRTNASSRNPCLPALAVVGPAKAATTSLKYSLLRDYSAWYEHLPDIRVRYNRFEIGVLWDYNHRSIQHYVRKHSTVSSELEWLINSKLAIPISQYPFLLFLEVLEQSELLTMVNYYLSLFLLSSNQSVYKDYNHSLYRERYMIDKTPRNLYLPHTAFIFGYYFSYKHVIRNVRGLKVVCILRNPYKRFRSWWGMKHGGLANKPEQLNLSAHAMLHKVLHHKPLQVLRSLVLQRDNEFDDTRIMLQWMRMYYTQMDWDYNDELHGILPSLYYPQLLTYVHWYRQLGLIEEGKDSLFKVIGFDWLVSNGTYALHLLNCWVRYAIQTMAACLGREAMPETSKFQSLNAKKIYLPVEIKAQLEAFFEPIKVKVDQLLFNYSTVVLGELANFSSLVY